VTSAGAVPQWLLSLAAAATMFAVMLDLGTRLAPYE